MIRRSTIWLTASLTFVLPALLAAQATTLVHPGKGGSPHVKTDWSIDGASISITYGRPSLKGRPEAQLMPIDRIWRTGADEATTLVTDRPLQFGSLRVPAGTYTLFTVPGESSWTLVVSRQTGQWGTVYTESEDLGRAPMTLERTAAPVELLTIAIDDTAAGGTLRFQWGTASAGIPFTVG